jgi:hypothetical protein
LRKTPTDTIEPPRRKGIQNRLIGDASSLYIELKGVINVEPLEFTVVPSEEYVRLLHRTSRDTFGEALCWPAAMLLAAAFVGPSMYFFVAIMMLVFLTSSMESKKKGPYFSQWLEDVGYIQYIVSDSGIDVQSRNARARYHWDTITGYRESTGSISLYYLGRPHLLIPKRSLSENQWAMLRQYLEQTKDFTKSLRREKWILNSLVSILLGLSLLLFLAAVFWDFEFAAWLMHFFPN